MFVCVSHLRRFGKLITADMLSTYYGYGEDISGWFANLKIASDEYKEHLNKYDVIKINMQEFLSATYDVDEMLKALQKRVLMELKRAYPEYADEGQLVWHLLEQDGNL